MKRESDDNRFFVRVKSAKKIHGNHLIRLNGMRFGYYKVIKVDRTRSSAVNKDIDMANAYWLCICERCGCKVSVRSDSLRKGISRMCGECSYEARENFRRSVLEEVMRLSFENVEFVEKPAPTMRKQRIKIRKLPPGTMLKIQVTKTFKGKKSIKMVRKLRDSGMSISDIAELLEITKDEVSAELKRTKSQPQE